MTHQKVAARRYVQLIVTNDNSGRQLLFRMAEDGTVEYWSDPQRRWVALERTD